MGMTTTTETQNTAGPQSAEARAALQRMGSLADSTMGQLGDLSNIANGNFELTPEQLQYLQRAQQAAGDMGRIQMDENMETAMRAGEDTAIGQNMTGGSFEAIQNALIGQQALRDANRQSLQAEGQTAQNMINMPLQYGQAQIAGNQALLQRLVQGTNPGLQYDATMRGLNSSQMTQKTVPLGQMAMQMASDVGSSMLMPSSAVTKA